MKETLNILLTVILLAWGAPAARAGSSDPANPAIRFFQDHISPVDGDRCPMAPSCSAYAARAVQKHGLVMGWIMACDRLVRCGRDEARISPRIRIKGRDYISDPVTANDFWWFEQKGDPKEQ